MAHTDANSPQPKQSLSFGLLLIVILFIVVAFVGYEIFSTHNLQLEIGTEDNPVIVGGKEFLESSILLEIIAMELEQLGAKVKKSHNVGSGRLLSMLNDNRSIHIYPEYTGTFLKEIVKKDEYANNERYHTYKRLNYIVENDFDRPQSYKILQPFTLINNTYVMVMMRDRADTLLANDLSLSRLSEVDLGESFKGGFSHDFESRIDGIKGLQKTYGLRIPQFDGIDHSVKYNRLRKGDADIVDGYASDPQLYFAEKEFVVIKDDKKFFPAYYPIPMVRKEVLSAYPDLEERLEQIANTLTIRTMAKIIRRIEAENITMSDLENSEEVQNQIRQIIKSESSTL